MNRLITAFLRIFFNLLYHQFSWSYDLVAATVSLGQWRSWVTAVIPYLPAGPLLEIGFGPGHLQSALAFAGRSPVGLDASPQMCRQAARRLRRRGQTQCLINGASMNMPFPAAAFNGVVATFPSEYIYERRTLAEIRRLLAPGGRLVIAPVAWLTGRSLPARFFAWVFRITRQSPPPPDPALLKRVEAPFVQAGFEVKTELVSLPKSTVLLIVAQNPAD